MSRNEALADIARRVAECESCRLCVERITPVPGEGNPEAGVMFIGEGPGGDEDRVGRPFVGRAGELLTTAIRDKAGVDRKDVYITNIVKCRPPGNRNPEVQEMKACSPFLYEQINTINPRVIVLLGKVVAEYLLKRPVKITKENGKFEFMPNGLCVMTVLHPAYVLRNKTQEVQDEFFTAIQTAFELAQEGEGL